MSGFWHFTDEADNPERQSDFHQPSRQGDDLRQANAQRAAFAMRQDEPPVTDTRVLVRVDDIVIAGRAPRIPCLRLAILAQLAARVHGLTKLANELLSGLGRDAGIPPLGPPLPACLRRPFPAKTAEAVMADHQVAPQPRSLFAAAGEGDPFSSRVWMPRYFYRAIAHADSRANGRSIVKRRRLTAARLSPPCLKAGALSRGVW